MKKNISKRITALALGIAASLLLLTLTPTRTTSEATVAEEPPEQVEAQASTTEVTTETILKIQTAQTEAQRAWMDKLIACESGGNAEALNPHDGGSRSVGILQFKDATFAHFTERYGLSFTAGDIYDPEKQKILAHYILKDGGEHHWRICASRIGENYPAN